MERFNYDEAVEAYEMGRDIDPCCPTFWKILLEISRTKEVHLQRQVEERFHRSSYKQRKGESQIECLLEELEIKIDKGQLVQYPVFENILLRLDARRRSMEILLHETSNELAQYKSRNALLQTQADDLKESSRRLKEQKAWLLERERLIQENKTPKEGSSLLSTTNPFRRQSTNLFQERSGPK